MGKSTPTHNGHAHILAKISSGGAVSSRFMASDRKGPLSDQNANIYRIFIGQSGFVRSRWPLGAHLYAYQLDTLVCGVSPAHASVSKLHRT